MCTPLDTDILEAFSAQDAVGEYFRGQVLRLRIIFGESLPRAETWVYQHHISCHSSDVLASLTGWRHLLSLALDANTEPHISQIWSIIENVSNPLNKTAICNINMDFADHHDGPQRPKHVALHPSTETKCCVWCQYIFLNLLCRNTTK